MEQDYGTLGPKLIRWQDRPCYIVGGGPSLIPWQPELWDLHQKGNVICVNDSYKRVNSPDLIVSLDHRWNSENMDKIWQMSAPVVIAVDESNPRLPSDNLTYLKRLHRSGINDNGKLSEDPTKAVNGMQSAHFALQVAYLKGAKTIYLLGLDFKIIDGRNHFHGGYKDEKGIERPLPISLFPIWADKMKDTLPQLLAAGVEVFNCSNDSLLTCFPHKSYESVL